MDETVRALPDAAVQETSFEHDVPAPQQQDDDHDDGGGGGGGVTARLTTTTKSTARAVAPDLLRGLLVVLMVLDHNSILNTWPRETALRGGHDNARPVHEWNQPQPYVLRLLTYLWPPGLTFLLGAGVVYFGRSRKALGWSSWALLGHFFARAVLLAALAVLLGVVVTGARVWLWNLILITLAVDYLLVGLLWVLVTNSEELLAFGLLRVLPESKDEAGGAREPLLAERRGRLRIASTQKIIRAADISWHVHNAVLLALAVATLGWNLWLSPTQGHCTPGNTVSMADTPRSNWFRIWFYPVEANHVLSLYPPLAWVSFAIAGLLYGRIVLARTWTRTALTLGHVAAGLALLLVFALTRLLRLGNLSEGCLQMPEHDGRSHSNQYLASARSFFYLTVYPPDVAFGAYSLGLNLLLLALLDVVPAVVAATVLQPLVALGTSPLFAYVAHLPLLAVARLFWLKLYGHSTGRPNPLLTGGDDDMGVEKAWVFWLNGALVLLVLYPLCRWYALFKETRGRESVWRFF